MFIFCKNRLWNGYDNINDNNEVNVREGCSGPSVHVRYLYRKDKEHTHTHKNQRTARDKNVFWMLKYSCEWSAQFWPGKHAAKHESLNGLKKKNNYNFSSDDVWLLIFHFSPTTLTVCALFLVFVYFYIRESNVILAGDHECAVRPERAAPAELSPPTKWTSCVRAACVLFIDINHPVWLVHCGGVRVRKWLKNALKIESIKVHKRNVFISEATKGTASAINHF